MGRRYSYSMSVIAGCFECHGTDGHWFAANAQAVAAKHHDKTGHTTWVDSTIGIRYGADIDITKIKEPVKPVQKGFIK